MVQKYVRGDKAVGICQRCSNKLPRRLMVEDEYYPDLIVCPDCKDLRHPQERLPKLHDPVTVYKPAPDDVGYPPVLSGELAGPVARLTWTEAEPINARIDSYDLYRSEDGVDFTLIVSLPITYDIFMAITDQDLTYDDASAVPGTEYIYYVVALTNPPGPDTLTSNRVTLDIPPNTSILPSAGVLAIAGELAVIPAAPAFNTALASSNVNGSDFTSPAPWNFGTSDFTCEFWFKLIPGVDNTQFRVLRARSSGGAASGWEVQVRTTGNPATKIMRLLMRPASTSFTYDSPAVSIADSVWAHYAFVVDRTANTCRFYVNGVFVSTISTATTVGAVGISAGVKSIMNAISGEVDELRVWTVARTGAEILANYLTPFTGPQTNLIANWQFNEGAGTTTTDSIQGTVATLVTGASFVTGPP